MTETFRYAAFISYSSKDGVFARRLHKALEGYGIPSSLGAVSPTGSQKRNRIYPVFRDREELSAGELGEQIESGLRTSGALIVVCSLDSAVSPWVQKEIELFAELGRRDRIFAIIADTAPLADTSGGDCTESCLPSAFRGDALAGDKLEPLAADARRGKDGFHNAWLKIVAGLVGISPGVLIDRDTARRRGRMARNAAIAVLLTIGAVGLIATESQWRPALYAQLNSERYYDVVFTEAVSGPRARSFEGARAGAEVLFNGVSVGEVTGLRLDADAPGNLLMQIGVDPDTPIRTDSRAELRRLSDGRIVLFIEPGTTRGALLEAGSRHDAPQMMGSVHESAQVQ